MKKLYHFCITPSIEGGSGRITEIKNYKPQNINYEKKIWKEQYHSFQQQLRLHISHDHLVHYVKTFFRWYLCDFTCHILSANMNTAGNSIYRHESFPPHPRHWLDWSHNRCLKLFRKLNSTLYKTQQVWVGFVPTCRVHTVSFGAPTVSACRCLKRTCEPVFHITEMFFHLSIVFHGILLKHNPNIN